MPLPWRSRNLALLLALVLSGAGIAAPAQTPVTVFAAASLKSALDEIAQGYAGGTASLQVSYGGSSTLARQIAHGAPAQVFVSANSGWMDVLERDGLLVPRTRADLLRNRLVLIAGPDAGPVAAIAPGFDLAGALGSGHLAMALVDAVPAGLYGRAALQNLGVWEQVRAQVLQADNVRAALILVAMGEAPLGIVYATDAAADPRVRVIGTFPADSHPPILYPAALIAAGPGQRAAQAVLDHLRGPEASAVFERHGFGLAGARE